ncbi:MAG: hypothetical protein ACI9AT_001695 [Ulvibacter sp.]|jgi:hypothetical protein
MKKQIFSSFCFYTLILICISAIHHQSYACTLPTYLTLNYTFTEATAGQTVEVTWVSDCPSTMMEITLVNVPLWTGQQFYANIPNTGSYFFAINPNIIPGETLFFIRDMGNNIWNYGPTFELLAPLPVELINFNGILEKDNSIKLNWSTASETNNSGFEIEQSVNGFDLNKISFVRGQGASSEIKNYEYTDKSAKPGTNYYRLKQIDFDGHFEYSQVVQVFVESKETGFRISPNPVQNDIHLFFNKPISDNLTINLFGLDGKILYSEVLPEDLLERTLPAIYLSPGIYFIEISEKGKQPRVEKIIKD